MKSLLLQQALHGYSDGHRLLGGSMEHSGENARAVLRLSDFSGAMVISGFEEYLTGYPLHSEQVYAFAKTWYANEMRRPGCVWTHTLFIPFSALESIPDLGRLIPLFTRPASASDGKAFSHSIRFQVVESPPDNSSIDITAGIEGLVEALYVEAKRFLLVPCAAAEKYETALIRIWSQQWPQARQHFSFCTGSLSARGIAGKPLNVQCTPYSLLREIKANTEAKFSCPVKVVDDVDRNLPRWAKSVVADAAEGSSGTFRQVLWACADGSDWKNLSSVANAVAQIISANGRTLEELLGVVAGVFPHASEGTLLKSYFFGSDGGSGKRTEFRERDLLMALASTPHYAAFDGELLKLERRGSDLFQYDPEEAQATLTAILRGRINPLGEKILRGMIDSMSPSTAVMIAAEHPEFVPAFARAKHTLAYAPDLWNVARGRERGLLESLIAIETLSTEDVEEIVAGLLEGAAESCFPRAVEAWGAVAAVGAFKWLSRGGRALTERSQSYVIPFAPAVVKWLSKYAGCTHRLSFYAACIFGPYTAQFREIDTTHWWNAYQGLRQTDNAGDADYFAAFLLALGLQNAPPNPTSLARACFERVHQLIWEDSLRPEAWTVLESILPRLSWYQDWDRCERLRRGLVQAFVRFHWPASDLAFCATSVRSYDQVLESAKKVDGGAELVSRLQRN